MTSPPREPDELPTGAVGSYDHAGYSFNIDPSKLYDDGVLIEKAAIEMQDNFNKIQEKWNSLKIGWMGAGSTSAEDFFGTYMRTRAIFFGLAEGEEPPAGLSKESCGMLPRLATVAKAAGALYGNAEDMAYQTWKEFHDWTGYALYPNVDKDGKPILRPDGEQVSGYPKPPDPKPSTDDEKAKAKDADPIRIDGGP
jgi:hypothetical protein